MSFKCEICNEAQETGTKPIKVTVDSRAQHYENKVKRGEKYTTVQSTGWEIVKEKNVCVECQEKIEARETVS